ncbi:MAG: hypothetical protein KGJ11_08415, partial [Candidatus Omnitrophica bacterium]|nr:hypothetical protein [Candidatus Omnitrophota bacterium]
GGIMNTHEQHPFLFHKTSFLKIPRHFPLIQRADFLKFLAAKSALAELTASAFYLKRLIFDQRQGDL